MSVFPKDPGPADYGAYLCSREELEDSYDRCRALKIPVELDRPRKTLPKIALAPRLAENLLLLTAVERVITPHHYAGPQNDHIYILCDQELVALKIFASPKVLAAAEETGVRPATIFTEESCGTNALTLAREHGRIIAIRGDQHYCKLFKDWWCVAGPVKDPLGNILGYLDISLNAEKELVSTIALLRALIASIEDMFSQLNFNHVEQEAHLPPSLPPEIGQELSLRQREILQLLSSGLTNKEIAEKCSLSIDTVKTHCRNIYRKVGVKKPREFRRKIRNRLLRPETLL
ncbi:MAG: LuxR C-terminal-related transcriptional regulator [Bacillota bacterium]